MTDSQSIYDEMAPREADALKEAIRTLSFDLDDGCAEWLPNVYRRHYSPDVLARFRNTLDDLASRFDKAGPTLTCVAEELLAYELLSRVTSQTAARSEDESVAGLYDLFEDYDFQVVYDADHEDQVASVHHHITGWWTPFSPVDVG